MATVAGLLSKGAVLSYKDSSGSKTIAAVKSIPAMGADPEKVDVTHLGSDKKAYIAGIQDSDNLEFAIIYQGDNFKDIDTLVKAGKAVEWTVTYSDGMKVDFTGQPSYKFDGVEVNQALGFNLVVVVSAGPNFTPASH
ncbi:phage tail tube protein [Lactococcus cremoris]|uniref:Major tail protein n=1 Tax=Lactococcus lactis subsp. cremoris (strain MG1363) TaxID=416870 RepID=A2RJI5_LACLM|nr:phage tail tube protein [Lactococcus cremoris]AAX13231.1 unknown [Lactococcus phage TP712]ADJ59855.1 major tail protein [Lactococcus cremoris subsp. cremoris NZ9000]KZK53702.1 Phage tail fiber [Lactococcus cremoris]MCT4434652.1 phage tail protein [Lactococcus cremoris]MCT4445805.1 phage tail protein [Lactococcus cremoris]